MITVTNGLVSIKVPKADIKSYLESGWRKIETAKKIEKPKTDVNEQDNTNSKPKQGQSK